MLYCILLGARERRCRAGGRQRYVRSVVDGTERQTDGQVDIYHCDKRASIHVDTDA